MVSNIPLTGIVRFSRFGHLLHSLDQVRDIGDVGARSSQQQTHVSLGQHGSKQSSSLTATIT